MKLETIRQALQEIASGAIPGHKAGMWIEDHARDIDTLLAEVERLRAAPPAPPLPAEVEEMRKKLDGPHEWGYRCLAEGPLAARAGSAPSMTARQ